MTQNEEGLENEYNSSLYEVPSSGNADYDDNEKGINISHKTPIYNFKNPSFGCHLTGEKASRLEAIIDVDETEDSDESGE